MQENILDLNLPAGNDLAQYGHLLLDGELNIKAHEDQKTKHRYAFIFEKLMILVKNVNNKMVINVIKTTETLSHLTIFFCSFRMRNIHFVKRTT